MLRHHRRTKRTRSPGSAHNHNIGLEALESRVLLTADLVRAEIPANLGGIDPEGPLPTEPPPGVVLVVGTEEADKIRAHVDGDDLVIQVNDTVQVYDANEVDIIAVWTAAGDDEVVFEESVVQQDGIIVAGAGNDHVIGGSGDDYILGGDGDDRIRGRRGNDFIDGDAGNDYLGGNRGHDAILGGKGDDVIGGGVGDDAIAGGSGNDLIRGGNGDNWLFGDATNEVPSDYSGLVQYARRYANANRGHDQLFGGAHNDVLLAGHGNDLISTGDGINLAVAGTGDDRVYGGDDTDYLFGGWGADGLSGRGGDDVIVGDPVDNVDDIAGEPMFDFHVNMPNFQDADDLARDVDNVVLPATAVVIDDTLRVARRTAVTSPSVVDVLRRTSDRIAGGRGNDLILGMLGDDSIHGGRGRDRIGGGAGDDHVHGGNGADVLVGQRGNDHVHGGNGEDAIYGSRGNDVLTGGHGDDALYGGAGADILNGETGNDLLVGGADTDVHVGGAGADKIHALDGFFDFIFADEEDEIEKDPFDLVL